MQAFRTIYIAMSIGFLLTIIAGFNMSSVQLPARQCLTCASNGATCDGGFPVCSSCLSSKEACEKPEIEIEVPWEKSPISQSCEVLSLDSTHNDAFFTEDFIKTQHGGFLQGMTQVYETLHRTLPYNYLNDASDAREVLWKGEYDLAPWTVRLGSCKVSPDIFGRTIIYDIRTKHIIQWPNNSPGYTNTTPSRLERMPWSNGRSRHVDSEPPAPPSGYVDYVANGYKIVDPTPDADQYLLEGYDKRAAQKR
ncbi:uncharacterized protein EAE97_002836 [Botrytis byssoidea]|uniref:Zn(2)-C6 fungal-type domain-containing protein n=1 Tax=Botrytis byssoidea TaxID=139641 RepID=A0A9P5IP95_9HELO|nr:uncharacterized protein EAE97_002836 [Botrytis byssoidea]KAF7949327.1 hypothetical protein EAE97_002836 [Botrytis byssoidea]